MCEVKPDGWMSEKPRRDGSFKNKGRGFLGEYQHGFSSMCGVLVIGSFELRINQWQ